MKASTLLWRVSVFLLFVISGSALTQAQNLTIDDFTAATQQLSVTDGVRHGFKRSRPSAPLIGASRYIILQASSEVPELADAAKLQIGDGYLAVQSSILVFPSIQVFYGVGGNAQEVPLHVDLSAYHKFRIHFRASDLGLNINMQVIAANNVVPAQSGVNIDGHPVDSPFAVDFDFNTFVPNAGSPPDFAHIDEIRLFIQSASAIGANDYAISLIEAVP